MKTDNESDAFTHHIMKNIDAKTTNSLSPSQLSAINNAIKASKPQQRHPIDFRGVLNLFFAKYYFVFLMGRDRRGLTQEKEIERRENVTLLGNIFFTIFVFSPFAILLIIFLYLLKVAVGIDIFADIHMSWIWDLLHLGR